MADLRSYLWDTLTLWIVFGFSITLVQTILNFDSEQIGILNFLLWRVFSCFGRVTPECARQHLDWYFCVNTQIASQFSVFSDSFAVLCSRSNSQFYGRARRTFPERLKTLHFNKKFVKTWSKVRSARKILKNPSFNSFLLHTDLGRKSVTLCVTLATNSKANEQCK